MYNLYSYVINSSSLHLDIKCSLTLNFFSDYCTYNELFIMSHIKDRFYDCAASILNTCKT